MTPEERNIQIEAMHLACRKVRLAIAVLDAEVPPDESTIARLDEALALLAEVRRDLAVAVSHD